MTKEYKKTDLLKILTVFLPVCNRAPKKVKRLWEGAGGLGVVRVGSPQGRRSRTESRLCRHHTSSLISNKSSLIITGAAPQRKCNDFGRGQGVTGVPRCELVRNGGSRFGGCKGGCAPRAAKPLRTVAVYGDSLICNLQFSICNFYFSPISYINLDSIYLSLISPVWQNAVSASSPISSALVG